jgi:hypothetical protein
VPAGRPKGALNKATKDIKALAAKHTPEALSTLVSVMTKGESERARVAAANSLLDRAYGRPKQDGDTQHLHAHVFMAMPPVARDAQEWLENHRKSLTHDQ